MGSWAAYVNGVLAADYMRRHCRPMGVIFRVDVDEPALDANPALSDAVVAWGPRHADLPCRARLATSGLDGPSAILGIDRADEGRSPTWIDSSVAGPWA